MALFFGVLGFIGSLAFACCSWPQALMAIKTKSADGVAWSFVLFWILGAFFSTVYVIITDNFVLLPNYLSGGCGMLIVAFIKLKRK